MGLFMLHVEKEKIIARIVNDLICAISNKAEADYFYSLMPVRLLPVSGSQESPRTPSVKGAEERIDREVKRTSNEFKRLVLACQRDWVVKAVWDDLGIPPGHACRSRPVVTMQDVCSEVPAAPLRATAEFWRGYQAGAQAQHTADAEAILDAGCTVEMTPVVTLAESIRKSSEYVTNYHRKVKPDNKEIENE